jgi:hypothetical protein
MTKLAWKIADMALMITFPFWFSLILLLIALADWIYLPDPTKDSDNERFGELNKIRI